MNQLSKDFTITHKNMFKKNEKSKETRDSNSEVYKNEIEKPFLAATVRNIEPDVGEFDWDGGMKRAGLRVRGCHCIVAGV